MFAREDGEGGIGETGEGNERYKLLVIKETSWG